MTAEAKSDRAEVREEKLCGLYDSDSVRSPPRFRSSLPLTTGP